MDLKDIIKWLIPCLFLFVTKLIKYKHDYRICLCLLFIVNSCFCVIVEKTDNGGFKIGRDSELVFNTTDVNGTVIRNKFSIESSRTFGRPALKKLGALLIPLAFQIGAASTWAIVSAIMGLKTLIIALIILKILLTAGAAKIGSLFSYKLGHQELHPQKEIHLHIHNSPYNQHTTNEDIATWSREGNTASSTDLASMSLEPYAKGPETINTPFGSYIRVGPTANVKRR